MAENLVTGPDGRVHHFPVEATPEQMQAAMAADTKQQPEPTIGPAQKSWSESLGLPPVLKQGMDAVEGLNSSANNLVYQGANLFRPAGSPSYFDVNPSLKKAIHAPDTLAGQIGRGVGDTLPYLAADAATGGVATLPIMSRVAARALTNAGISAVQSGGDTTQTLLGGAMGAGSELVSSAARGIKAARGAIADLKNPIPVTPPPESSEIVGTRTYTALRDMAKKEAKLGAVKSVDVNAISGEASLKIQAIEKASKAASDSAAEAVKLNAQQPKNVTMLFRSSEATPGLEVPTSEDAARMAWGLKPKAAPTSGGAFDPVPVAGPTVLTKTNELLDKVLSDNDRLFMKDSSITPDNPKLVALAEKIKGMTTGYHAPDANGNLVEVGNAPAPFSEVWEMSKNANHEGFNNYTKDAGSLTNSQRHTMRAIGRALNEDIRDSMQNPALWGSDGAGALESFDNAKAAAVAKYAYFNKNFGMSDFLENTKSSTRALNDVLNSPRKLQQMLTTNKFIADGKIPIANPDMRGYAAGADLANVLDGAFSQNPKTANLGAKAITDPGPGKFNAQYAVDHFSDPSRQQINKLLYSKKKMDNIQELIRNLGAAQEAERLYKPPVEPPPIKYSFPLRRIVMSGTAGAMLGSMVGLPYGQGRVVGAAIGAGIELSAYALNKVTEGNAGKVFAAMAGAKPLEMPMENAIRIIGASLNGTRATIHSADGKEQPGTFTKNGFKPDD